MGIEPTSTAWEAVVLPMNYIRVFYLLMYISHTIQRRITARQNAENPLKLLVC